MTLTVDGMKIEGTAVTCAVLGLMATVATAAWAAGKLRRYVGERFEKERR